MAPGVELPVHRRALDPHEAAGQNDKSGHSKRSPLSHNQQYLWFVHQLNPESNAYVIPIAWRIRGPLNLSALQSSLNDLIQRHEALRLRFGEEGGQPYQQVCDIPHWPLRQVECQGSEPSQAEAKLNELLRQAMREPLDLSSSGPIRGLLMRLGAEDHALLLEIHHLVCDDWSCGILAAELSKLYAGHLQHTAPSLTALQSGFLEFVQWHRDARENDGFEKELGYWLPRLVRSTDETEAPFPPSVPAESSGSPGGRIPLHVPHELVKKLLKLGGASRATLFMTLLAGFHALLHRCGGQSRTRVGIPSAGRLWSRVESTVGYFVNTLPHAADFQPSMSFTELIEDVRGTLVQDLAHSDVPYGRIVNGLQKVRGLPASRSPLLTSMFTLRQSDSEFGLEGLRVEGIALPALQSQFPLSLWLAQKSTGLHGYLSFATESFDEFTARGLASSYLQLLESAVAEPARPIFRWAIMSAFACAGRPISLRRCWAS
ncbi:MAG: hypothetical protein FJ404_16790 [Verrucomicrobia bacterium]|nr:hypothetical protein [Verrucomicrobiota bacterium]